jgi:imidazolonepropionase-like amidohydrolase
MKARGIRYDPTLVAAEAAVDLYTRNPEPLERPLVMQVGPADLLQATRALVGAGSPKPPVDMAIAAGNLQRATRAGVALVVGTGSGRPLLIHGPAIHRELQLWVAAGLKPGDALRAATYEAARLLRVDKRAGILAIGHEADLLIVNGNPLQDIRQTESIQQVIDRGELIDRSELLNQE